MSQPLAEVMEPRATASTMACDDESTSLLHLPPELLERILGELQRDQLFHAAASCRALSCLKEAAAALCAARIEAQIPALQIHGQTSQNRGDSRPAPPQTRLSESSQGHPGQLLGIHPFIPGQHRSQPAPIEGAAGGRSC